MSLLLVHETPAPADLDIDTVDTSEVRIVAPQGRLDVLSAPILREHLDQLLAEGATKFVIDLSAVPFLDSAGMSVLVSLLKRARQGGGNVTLVAPRATVPRQLLDLTRFDQVFPMADSVEAALRGAW